MLQMNLWDYVRFGFLDVSMNIVTIIIALYLFDKYRDKKVNPVTEKFMEYLQKLEKKLDKKQLTRKKKKSMI